MTFLGPIERLKFWHKPTARGYNNLGVMPRRATEMVDDEVAAAVEVRYLFHPFKTEAME